MSMVKTTLLLSLLTILFVLIGYMLGGPTGALITFILAITFNFGSYWYSDRIVLTLYKAKPLSESDAPEVFDVVRELTGNAGLPMPKICIAPGQAPNAFATGRNPSNSAVVVTRGILDVLTLDELKGVLAHEISHIKNRDTLISTIAATIAGAITMLATWARWMAIFGGFGGDDEDGGNIFAILIIAILAPIAALIIQLAISRTREYVADRSGAKISHNPLFLARALEKLDRGVRTTKVQANPSTAHLFIVNPLSRKNFLSTLFSTHPPIEERIKRLRQMIGSV